MVTPTRTTRHAREVKLVSGAKEVKAFVARPAAIAPPSRSITAANVRAFERFERTAAYEFGQTVHADGRITGVKRATHDEEIRNDRDPGGGRSRFSAKCRRGAARVEPRPRRRRSRVHEPARAPAAPWQPSVADFDLPAPQAQTGRRSTIQHQAREDFPAPEPSPFDPTRPAQRRRLLEGFDRAPPLPVRIADAVAAARSFRLAAAPQEPSSLHPAAPPRRLRRRRRRHRRSPFHNDTMVELLADGEPPRERGRSSGGHFRRRSRASSSASPSV